MTEWRDTRRAFGLDPGESGLNMLCGNFLRVLTFTSGGIIGSLYERHDSKSTGRQGREGPERARECQCAFSGPGTVPLVALCET